MEKVSFISVLQAMLVVCTLVSCTKFDLIPPELSSISVKTSPDKVDYFVGEALDLSGLVVTLTMDNGDTKDIPFSGFANSGITCSPINGVGLTTAIASIRITHNATGKNVNQAINVTEIVVITISVKTPPTIVEYVIGNALDLAGLVVTINMNDGSTEDLSFFDFESRGIRTSPANGTILTLATSSVLITHTTTEKTVTQAIEIITLIDIDGNNYSLVKIGNQIWMAENLKTTKFKDGTIIPLATDNTTWNNIYGPGYCWYSDDKVTYGDTYGALYNWKTIETGNLCPTGWHSPSYDEWTDMERYLSKNGFNYDGTIGGNKIAKALAATTDWISSTEIGAIGNDLSLNNTSGFKALPGGYRHYRGSFSDIGYRGYWWASVRWPEYRVLLNNKYFLVANDVSNNWGFSARCIKD